MNISKTVKRLENGDIWINDNIKNKMLTINNSRLFDAFTQTAEELKMHLIQSKSDLKWKLEKNLELNCYEKEFHIPIRIPLFLFEESEEIYYNRESLKSHKKSKKIISGKKAALTRRKKKLEEDLLDNTDIEYYRKNIFPELLLYLYEIYKEHYEALDNVYKLHKSKAEKFKIAYENALTSYTKSY